ncbi:MAG: rhodanese-like domain-containing protein [Fluviicola sp.]|nr:rhodanese-like domain-containing protein [Fluviicola sp.]
MFGNLFKKTDYKKLLNEDGAVIIDVRSPSEFASGSLPGSENIPLGSIPGKTKKIKSLGVPVICVCASGMRSGGAKAQLKAAGVDAYNGGPWTKMLKYVE